MLGNVERYLLTPVRFSPFASEEDMAHLCLFDDTAFSVTSRLLLDEDSETAMKGYSLS